VALNQPEIGRTDPDIPIDNNFMDDELHVGMSGGGGDYGDRGDEGDERIAIPSAGRRRRAVTVPEWFDLETSDLDGYEGEVGEVADVDEAKEAS
jgi:hypothetical protein